jgi:hypothetical protein
MAKIAATNFVTNCQKYGRIRNSNKCSKMTDFVTNFRTNVLFTNFVISVTDFVRSKFRFAALLPFPCFLPFLPKCRSLPFLPRSPSLPIDTSLPKGYSHSQKSFPSRLPFPTSATIFVILVTNFVILTCGHFSTFVLMVEHLF